MTPGVGDALVQEPGVELVVGLEAQPRGEEPTADDPDLVLDLPLLPSRSRRACCRFDQVVATHLHEAPVERALLADEDGLHRRLHVVVDASPAGTLEQPECPVVGVEHHLLALARISADEEHSAVAQPDVHDLDLGRQTTGHFHLVHVLPSLTPQNRPAIPECRIGRFMLPACHELPPLAMPGRPKSPVPSLPIPGQCAPQQRLYFRPEPHGQGSLRPTLRPKDVGSS